MEFQKIVNLLDITSDDKDMPRFFTKKWIEVYDQSEKNYNVNKEIRIKTPMLRSDLCDFSDAYILVKGDITLEGNNDANKRNKNLTFKNNAPFINCIWKINGVKKTGSLWNYYRGEPSNPLSTNSESFKYKTSILGKTLQNNDSLTNAEVVIPLKHLSNFWKNRNIPLINCEVELILTWFKNCVLADMTAIVAPSGATFKITDTKLHVPVVTLSKENDTKHLEHLKTGFKRTFKNRI